MWKVLLRIGHKAVRRIIMAIINGKEISAKTREQIALDAQKLMAETGIRPGLAVVIVGDDPASHVSVSYTPLDVYKRQIL